VKGKHSYLAPELVQGKHASPLSDLYALGIVLWEALSGQRLYAGETDAERIRKVRMATVLTHERLMVRKETWQPGTHRHPSLHSRRGTWHGGQPPIAHHC